MVRRIAEKLNLDTSFIFEELNEGKKNEPKYNPVINKESPRKKEYMNQFRMVIISGFLGLLTSIFVLKYIENNQSDSFNRQESDVLLLDKN